MKTENSKAAWSLKKTDNGHFIMRGNEVIFKVPESGQSDHAQFIVTACNSHAALVEALDFIVNCIPEQGEDAVLDADGYNKACAALKLAKGEQ